MHMLIHTGEKPHNVELDENRLHWKAHLETICLFTLEVNHITIEHVEKKTVLTISSISGVDWHSG